MGTSYVGLFFCYRCLHPVSGVSPLVPVLLLLFAWYLWALFQTARLRFSAMNRPRLPGPVISASSYPLFVTEQSLGVCNPPLSCCLFENIELSSDHPGADAPLDWLVISDNQLGAGAALPRRLFLSVLSVSISRVWIGSFTPALFLPRTSG